jgi:hypothetical protein
MGKISQIRLYIKQKKGITRKELDALTGNRAEGIVSQSDKQANDTKEKKKFNFAK